MSSRTRVIRGLSGAVWLGGIASLVAIGCRGASPFLAAQFATNISNNLPPNRGGTSQPTTSSQPTNINTAVASICDVDASLRNLSVTLFNESQQQVRYSMTFLVSAGPGGFVSCESEIDRYTGAGYSDACPPGQCSTFTVGCDTITLVSGTRLLRLEFGINQGQTATLPANTSGDPTGNLPSIQLRLANGSTLIPVPEIIVFGSDSDANFLCLGGDLCTQRGFVYSSPPPANLPIGKPAEAIRIQGTVCNRRVGTAPEWRLDRTPFNNSTPNFQFPMGGTIIVNVLDRSSDALTNNRNQVVWTVTDVNGATLHFPER